MNNRHAVVFASVLVFAAAQSGHMQTRIARASCSLIQNAKILDPESGSVLVGSSILIRGERIAYVGNTPPGSLEHCQKLKLPSLILLPGLIDTHTHLLTTDTGFGADFSKELLRTVLESSDRRIHSAKEHARALLMSGFTTVRDLGNSGRFLDTVLRREIEANRIAGPRLFCSGPGFAAPEGQFATYTSDEVAAREYTLVRLKADFGKLLQPYKSESSDWIKIYADNDPNPNSLSLKQLKVLIETVHANHFKAAVHTTTEQSARNALDARADSLEHGLELSDRTLQLMAAKRTYLVPTDLNRTLCAVIRSKAPNGDCGDFETYQRQMSARLKRALKYGVPIAFGSDMYLDLSGSGFDRGQAAKETLFAYVENGMSPLEALKSATTQAANLLGKATVLGTIRPGAFADLIGVSGNPLQDIKSLNSIRFVMKGGRIFLNQQGFAASQ